MTDSDSAALAARMVEDHHASWFAYQAGLPGVTAGVEPDVVWITHAGRAWGNALIRLRLDASNADGRLDRLLGRYRALGRPVGVWVSPFATPPDLEDRLRRRGLRCRKRFPGMHADLTRAPGLELPPGVTIEVVTDWSVLERDHPAIGPITTPNRRHTLARTRGACTRLPLRAFQLLARLNGEPAGAALVFLDGESSGLHDVGVPETLRLRGIGGALVARACTFARERGYADMVLIASGMGEAVYRRAGFVEVCRFGYFYSRLGRDG